MRVSNGTLSSSEPLLMDGQSEMLGFIVQDGGSLTFEGQFGAMRRMITISLFPHLLSGKKI